MGDHGGVRRGLIGERRAGGAGRPAANVDIVFDGEGHAEQRQAAEIAGDRLEPLRQLPILLLALRRRGEIQPGVIVWVQPGDQRFDRRTDAGKALARRAGLVMVLPFTEGKTARYNRFAHRLNSIWYTRWDSTEQPACQFLIS